MEDIRGINESKIDLLVIELSDYADKINKIFNDTDDIMQKVKSSYNSNSALAFLSSYNNLSSNYHTINQNIIGYAKDLVNIKKIYKAKTQTIADDINKYNA